MKAIVIENVREGYGIDQIENRAMTLGELISQLEQYAVFYGRDTKVVISNDNRYTYGPVMRQRIDMQEY